MTPMLYGCSHTIPLTWVWQSTLPLLYQLLASTLLPSKAFAESIMAPPLTWVWQSTLPLLYQPLLSHLTWV